MKYTLTFSALVCAALATAATAFPTPAEPLFVSRMVKRDSTTSSSTCGSYQLPEPAKLQLGSYNDSATTYTTISDNVLTALPSSAGEQGAAEFDFQTCDYQGFTQSYSRNAGGSMGAPLEFWGRVTTNVTTSDSSNTTKCLAASPSASNKTQGTFQLADCDDTDKAQWFRMQEGFGTYISYFPVKNETGYVYDGQTPEYFTADLHTAAGKSSAVGYTPDDTQLFAKFD